jgi:uncharacterized membrane protein YhaH (DUF805 family)
MQWYLDALKKYAVFSGRARRSEFWNYVLFTFLAIIALSIVGAVLDAITGNARGLWVSVLVSVYALATVLPSLAVTVRRLHDTGRSGWYYFMTLIPAVGPIILLVFECQDSVADNQYGPNPKAVAA